MFTSSADYKEWKKRRDQLKEQELLESQEYL